jgi:hypothetical protein
MKGVLFFFITTIFASKSLDRCNWAKLVQYTEQPPFDGNSITLYWSRDYPESELRETANILGGSFRAGVDKIPNEANWLVGGHPLYLYELDPDEHVYWHRITLYYQNYQNKTQ